MSHHASFWDNPGQGDDTPVVRHAPDSQNYHYPDWDQVSKMRGSRVGAFAIIPAANKDGTSKGFDADEPGVVHVDPDAPDGGAIVDLAQVSKRDMNTALSQSVYPHQVFYRLGMPAPLYKNGVAYERPTMPEPPRVNPVMPGTYVVPKAADNGVQMPIGGMTPVPGYNPQFAHAQEEPRVIPNQLGQPPQLQIPQQSAQTVAAPAPQPMNQPMAQPMAQPMVQPMAQPMQPQYGGYPPGYGHPGMLTPPPMDPQMQSMLLQLTQTVQGLSAQVQQMQHQKQAELSGPARTPQLSSMPVGGPQNAMTPPNLYPIGQGPKKKRRPADDDDVYDDDATPIGQRPEHDPSVPRTTSMVQREQRQRLKDYQQAQSDDEPGPTNALITGFETLKMPFVTGPLPHKAKRQVFFEFEGIGKQSARYHDVIDSDHCVALVYDTRYEDGTQYLPPDLGEKQIRLHVPHIKKTFTVSSMGFAYTCGVLDHIVLVKHDEEDLDVAD